MHDPDQFVSQGDLAFRLPLAASPADRAPPWPWANMTIWRLMTWAMTGSRQKSATEVTRLVTEVIQASDFTCEELTGFNAQTATGQFDAAQKSLLEDHPFVRDNWKQTSVDIVIPTREKSNLGNGQDLTVDGFYYRPILEVIWAVFIDPLAKQFHLMPFRKVSKLW